MRAAPLSEISVSEDVAYEFAGEVPDLISVFLIARKNLIDSIRRGEPVQDAAIT